MKQKPQLVSEGDFHQLGVKFDGDLLNIAVYAPDAMVVSILFFMPNTEELVSGIEIEHRTGKVFHGKIKGVEANWLYAFKVTQKGEVKGKIINDKLLMDPYAKSLNRSLIWNEALYQDNSPFWLPKAHLTAQPFDWQNTSKPNIPKSKTILYETHVKGFTQEFKQIPSEIRGKYLGLAEPAAIHHMKTLGITSIQLMPVFSFMSEPRLEELGLTNYWGYNPVNFFAPDFRYANSDAVIEFKTMVRELHKAGIEVILDVVFNHTAEGNKNGPVISFKGLCEAEFYLRDEDAYSFEYANYSGCGNTVNPDSDFGFRIILDALRYWLEDMQVDGFRFDLAATLGRNGERFNRRAALFRAMAQDPIIGKAKLIAEPWDIGPEGYQLGNFPEQWLECNDKYRDCIRQFWRGDKGLVPEVATRMLGSRDIFKKGKRSQVSSVNYVAYHDGYTLQDIVSFEERHNLANLENNRDGHGANYSKNYGTEGPSNEPCLIELREKQKRNFISTLFLSQGVPHLLAGDEMGRSQKGNNNAYCQDNELSWLNWELDQRQSKFLSFVQYVIRIRSEFPVLQHCVLADDGFEYHEQHHHVAWLKPDGTEKQVNDWQDPDNQCLGLIVADDDKQYQLMFILNASEHFKVYQLPNAKLRTRLLDTSLTTNLAPTKYMSSEYTQEGQSLSLWKLDYV